MNGKCTRARIYRSSSVSVKEMDRTASATTTYGSQIVSERQKELEMLATVILQWSEDAGHTGTVFVPDADGLIITYREWRGDELDILRNILGSGFNELTTENHKEFERQSATGTVEWPHPVTERAIEIGDGQVAQLRALTRDRSFEVGINAARLPDGLFGFWEPL